ncbi:MAG: thioredoxin domain-containing protein [Candidatus Omnitrophota bacterium]|jgi:protein-disulfide isomerase
MKKQKVIMTAFIMIALLGVVGVLRWVKTKRVPAPKAPLAVKKTLGDPEALIKIVEYSDFQCSACAKGHGVLREFLIRAPDKIFLEFRYFPIEEIHPQAFRSAIYAECAARQEQFWPLQELLFSGQAQWSKEGVDAEAYFKAYATSLKVDLGQLDACVNDDTVENVIVRDSAEARFRGVSATPTFFVNGKMILGATALREELIRLLLAF